MAIRTPSLPRPRLVIPVVLGLVLLVVVVVVGTGIATNVLFFREVGFGKVYTTVLFTRIVLFVVFGLVMALAVGANIVIAHAVRPPFRPLSAEQQSLERYRSALEPYRRWLLLAVVGILGLIAGASAQGRWQTWLLWRNGQPFGTKDPQFHKDISFYAFDYPFYRWLLGFAFGVVIVCFIVALLTHYVFGGIRLQSQGEKVIAAAKVHLSVLFGLLVLLKAVAYYLDRFGLSFSGRGVATGASYTDIHAVLPAKNILAVVSLLCAALFFYNIRRRGWALPGVAFGLTVLSSVVIGGIYPAFVQQFQVKPNEVQRETPYIQRNIDATRAAYGLDKVIDEPYDANNDATSQQIKDDVNSVPKARLLDPNILEPTFQQLQQKRFYYGFPTPLDVDRYDLGDGNGMQDYIVAAREVDLSGLQGSQRNWINEHLSYTHGNGFVAAPANVTDAQGRPSFAIKDIPPTGGPTIDQPRIYYGEKSPDYSVVGTKQPEIDGPGGPGQDQATNSYDGKGGVALTGFNKVLFALKFHEKNLLLSDALTGSSRIMYNREPRERVQKVAPFLKLDSDPYPAIVDGRIVWIIDGYTTSSGYPYSQESTLGNLVVDSTRQAAQPQEQVNYIRNSVKATVDAYDGTVTLYAFDESDPVLRTWMKAFPGIVKPASDISPELRAHFRYPEDFFKVQRDLLARYHVTVPAEFYSKEDFWQVPADPTTSGGANQPPYYLFGQVPGQSEPTFNLTSTYTAQKRPNMSAYLAVSSDPGSYGEMRLLRLPPDSTQPGVGQVQQTFDSFPAFARDFSLFNQNGSRATKGNLLTIPVANGLLFIEPLYVQSAFAESFPVMRKVLVAYGDKATAYEDTLAQALDTIFGPGTGDNLPGAVSAQPGAPPATGETPPATGGTPTSPSGDEALRQAINDAQEAYNDAQAALQKQPPDFAAYGTAQQRLSEALNRLAQLGGTAPAAGSGADAGAGTGGATASPAPMAGASPSGEP